MLMILRLTACSHEDQFNSFYAMEPGCATKITHVITLRGQENKDETALIHDGHYCTNLNEPK